MKICPSCGKRCADSSEKCIYCGSGLEIRDSEASFEQVMNENGKVQASELPINATDAPELFENIPAPEQSPCDGCAEKMAENKAQSGHVYNFHDSLPHGFSMTQEEALSLLFDDNNADSSDDDFGNAVPMLSDDEIVLKRTKSLSVAFGGLAGVLFCIAYYCVFTEIVLMLFGGVPGVDAVVLFGIPQNVAPYVVIGFSIVLLFSYFFMFVASIVSFFVSSLSNSVANVSFSISCIKWLNLFASILLCVGIVYFDVSVSLGGGLFPLSDNMDFLLLLMLNLVVFLSVIRGFSCFAASKNCTDVINVAQRLKAPSYSIDITFFAETLFYIAIGFIFVFNGGITLLSECRSFFSIFIVMAYFTLLVEKLFFAYSVIAYRSEINSTAQVALSVEECSSHKIKYR